MDENGAQESGMDFYAQFNSLKALEKKFLKSNHQFSLAVQSPAGRVSLIAKSGWISWQTLYSQGNPVVIFQKFLCL